MSTERFTITVGGHEVEVVRKDIKNLHLGVYPPDGRIRIAVPTGISEDAVRLAIGGKLPWIKRKKAELEAQPRLPKPDVVSGESHYLFGNRFTLNVINDNGRQHATWKNRKELNLHVRPGAARDQRLAVLERWQRAQLRDAAETLVGHWSEHLGVNVEFLGIRKMRTRWGTCNPTHRRVWLNFELAKKPRACIEYIVAHELVHLIEPSHGPAFVAEMDQAMPDWRHRRDRLNSAPLAHEDWGY